LVLISYDLITIPFNQAFTPAPSWFSVGMDWITLLFWTADMLQGFFLGYFEKGIYVSDNRRVLKHYLITWFVPDLVVVGPEWVMTLSSSIVDSNDAENYGEIGKVLKGARAVRVLRLLRLLKLQRIINMLYDMIESEHTFICVNLAKLLVAVLVLNHVIACVWFLIGRVCMQGGVTNWIEVGSVEDTSLAYKYTTSLHWSLTQFTPASMDISARNVWERAFSIVVLFFAMVAFSSIVASITGSMTSLRNMKTEDMKQFWRLRRYLRQRGIEHGLSDRIWKYLEHEVQKQGKLLQRKSITVLQYLSMALQSELAHALSAPNLTGHPFFHLLDCRMKCVMHRLCHMCLKPQSHAENEVVFSAGEKATRMLFIQESTGGVSDGHLEYTTAFGEKLFPSNGDWVSEAVLWTDWRHRGELMSITTNDLIGVDPNLFMEVMCIHPRPWCCAKRYGNRFIRFINSMEARKVTDILRSDTFYDEAVVDCDRCTSNAVCDEDSVKGNGEGEADTRSDASGPSHGRGKEDEQPHEKALVAAPPAQTLSAEEEDWHRGSNSRQTVPVGAAVRRRAAGLCQCLGIMSSESWCAANPSWR